APRPRSCSRYASPRSAPLTPPVASPGIPVFPKTRPPAPPEAAACPGSLAAFHAEYHGRPLSPAPV
ncbi:MAG: hypothetical protein ACLP01_11085, partial [Solirubrobacteraceae bacterium]